MSIAGVTVEIQGFVVLGQDDSSMHYTIHYSPLSVENLLYPDRSAFRIEDFLYVDRRLTFTTDLSVSVVIPEWVQSQIRENDIQVNVQPYLTYEAIKSSYEVAWFFREDHRRYWRSIGALRPDNSINEARCMPYQMRTIQALLKTEEGH